jgi:hypothetical protein
MTPVERKAQTEKILAEKGISFLESLPLIESAEQISLKDFDTVCRRAVAALLCTQMAISLNENDVEGAGRFANLVAYFDVNKSLNAKESKLFNGTASQQDVVDIVWEYECCWALFWALGLLDDISDASSICDCEKAISFVSQCESLDDFKSKCKLRSADEILDMLDLYYRYHWAVVQHEHIDKNCSIGSLNGDVVFERRRGLEWLICDTEDWNDISLDT